MHPGLCTCSTKTSATFGGMTKLLAYGPGTSLVACSEVQAIAKHSGDVFIPRGVDVPALDRSISYEFAPQKVKVRSCA